MTALPDLSAILDEGERLIDPEHYHTSEEMGGYFYKHGPLLLRLARAGADQIEPFLRRVAAGPCWANRGGMTECKDAFMPKGERAPSEFCLRCHAVAMLAAFDAAREGR